MTLEISRITAPEARTCTEDLYDLFRDSVEGNASIGYVLPLDQAEIVDFWDGVFTALEKGTKIMLVARQAGRIVGCVQLDLAQKPNGRHRAEVQKLLVHSAARRQGIGAKLMQAIEAEAKAAGRHLLVLDTASGESAEPLYLKLGYQIAGRIPQFALAPDRSELEATTVMYKLLENN